jgi:hypothetical protein
LVGAAFAFSGGAQETQIELQVDCRRLQHFRLCSSACQSMGLLPGLSSEVSAAQITCRLSVQRLDTLTDHQHLARVGEAHGAFTAGTEHHFLRINRRFSAAITGEEGAMDRERCPSPARRVASINVEAQCQSVTLKYRSRSYGDDWSDVEQRIAIAWTPCRFGSQPISISLSIWRRPIRSGSRSHPHCSPVPTR